MDQDNNSFKRGSARHEWSRWKGKKSETKKKGMRLVSAILFLAALLIILVFVRRGANTFHEAEAKRDTLLELTADRIIAVEMNSPKGKVSFVRDDGKWRSTLRSGGGTHSADSGVVSGETERDEDSSRSLPSGGEERDEDSARSLPSSGEDDEEDDSRSLPSEEELEEEAAAKLAASVTGVRLYRTLTGVEDLKLYGLDVPQAVIKVTDRDGAVTEIAIGDVNETTSTVYCCLNGDKDTVYAVSTSLLSSLQ